MGRRAWQVTFRGVAKECDLVTETKAGQEERDARGTGKSVPLFFPTLTKARIPVL